MDLPPDKAKILRGYDSKKKWELICDQASERRSCWCCLCAVCMCFSVPIAGVCLGWGLVSGALVEQAKRGGSNVGYAVAIILCCRDADNEGVELRVMWGLCHFRFRHVLSSQSLLATCHLHGPSHCSLVSSEIIRAEKERKKERILGCPSG